MHARHERLSVAKPWSHESSDVGLSQMASAPPLQPGSGSADNAQIDEPPDGVTQT